MHDFTILPPDCIGQDDCGSPNYAIALFISFYGVCTYIFVNLFTAVIYLQKKSTHLIFVDRLLLIISHLLLIREINFH